MFLEGLIRVADHPPVGRSDDLPIPSVDPIYDLLDGCPGPVATLAFTGAALNETSTSDTRAFALLKVPKTGVKFDAPFEVHHNEAPDGSA